MKMLATMRFARCTFGTVSFKEEQEVAYHIRNLKLVPEGLSLGLAAVNAWVAAVSMQHHPARLASINHHQAHIPVLHLQGNVTC